MTPTPYYVLDAHGEPVAVDDVLTWGRWFNDFRGRIVLQDYPVRRVFVSTVFLGLDHQWGEGLPVLWETMIFGGPFNEHQERYCSRLDALTGHTRCVALVELYYTAPRKLKKALLKFAGSSTIHPAREERRLALAFARVGWTS